MKNEKKTVLYESPELEIIAFEICDIITTSGFTGNDYESDENQDPDWYEN